MRLRGIYKLLAGMGRLGVDSYWDLLDLAAFTALSILVFLSVYLLPRLLLRIMVGW